MQTTMKLGSVIDLVTRVQTTMKPILIYRSDRLPSLLNLSLMWQSQAFSLITGNTTQNETNTLIWLNFDSGAI